MIEIIKHLNVVVFQLIGRMLDVPFLQVKRSTFHRPSSAAAAAPLNLPSKSRRGNCISESVTAAASQRSNRTADFFSLFPPRSIIIIIIVASGREGGGRSERAVAAREGAG